MNGNWSLILTLRPYGLPKAQPRPRAAARGGHAHVYNPKDADEWKAAVALSAIPHRGDQRFPLAGPVRVDIRFFFPAPQRLARAIALGPVLHDAKPDRDNLDKAVLDALTDIGAWYDDSQVAAGMLEKWYESPGNKPGAEIDIYSWKEASCPSR